jgi:hypothetical protein
VAPLDLLDDDSGRVISADDFDQRMPQIKSTLNRIGSEINHQGSPTAPAPSVTTATGIESSTDKRRPNRRKSANMKSSVQQQLSTLLLLSCGLAQVQVQSFAPSPSVLSCKESRTSVYMGGFLDGRVPKNDIMKKEDEAMWIDDGIDKDSKKGGWNPFAIAKTFDKPKPKSKSTTPTNKKAPPSPPPKKTEGFKMPWDK